MTSEKKFDLRVHLRDQKTGKIEKTQPYQLKVSNGEQRFYRGGVQFYANGEPVNPEEAKKMKAPMTVDERKEAELRKKIKAELKAEIIEEFEKADLAAEKRIESNEKAKKEEIELGTIANGFGFSEEKCQEIFKKENVQTFEEAKKALTFAHEEAKIEAEIKIEKDKKAKMEADAKANATRGKSGKNNRNAIP